VPHLLIVVPASASANQTIDLRSPVVIDRDGSVARVFGAESAPTAIMVDARGAVASELAAGANQVAALVTGSMPHVRARVRWAGLDLEVSREAPPPPPEFETVAEKAVELARERDARIVAAVGAGSGAIPILLARELPEARIYTTDISAEALAVAHRNVERHGMTGRVELLLGELLAPVPERPDLIVATFPEPSGDAGGDGSESDARLLEQMTERGWSVPVVNHLGSVAAEADQDQAQPAPAPARRRAFGTWPTISLLRRNAGLRARLASLAAPAREQPGLPVGSPAPNFRVRGLDGNRVTLDALRSGGRAVLLLFVSPTCGPCIGLMPDIARWQDEYAPALSLALISSGSAQANREKAKEYGASRILLQRSFEVGDAYAVTGTPSAVLVHPDGTIASPLAGGPDMIRALLDQYIEVLAENAGFALEDEGELDRAARAAAAPLEIGAAAPNLELVDLAGNIVRPADFRGRDTVLLFWGLSCGFCREMLPDVREWERRRPQGAPDLLVVLASEPQPGQRLPFESPVVIDRESAAASALHSGGTPTAILIDRQGRIGSQPVVGAVPILDLLGSAAPVSDRASA
jgi:thiol-disulfide isomerase/thioredoxin